LTEENDQQQKAAAPASTPSAPASKQWLRFAPIGVIIVAAAAFFLSGAHRYLSLAALKEHHQFLEGFVAGNFVLALGIFVSVYIAVTALSLPGATLMSVLGGFLFGTLAGMAAVILAATTGATIIFLAAKTAFGDVLRRKAGGFIKRMEQGFKENAFSYLLLLRLIPLFPFFVVNVAPAFFGVKTRTFFFATLIGIIPGVFAFVSAGKGLGVVLKSGGELNLTGLLLQPAVLTPIIALSVLALIPVGFKMFNARSKVQSEDPS